MTVGVCVWVGFGELVGMGVSGAGVGFWVVTADISVASTTAVTITNSDGSGKRRLRWKAAPKLIRKISSNPVKT